TNGLSRRSHRRPGAPTASLGRSAKRHGPNTVPGTLVHVVQRPTLWRAGDQDVGVWGKVMLSVDTARDAGRRIYALLQPAWMQMRELGSRALSRLTPLGPVLAVAVVLLLMARFYYDGQRYLEKLGPGALAGFADIGIISGSHLGLESLVLDHNPTGFDGQFF